ncbi:hypothetical protein GQ464_014310 [Rhodocaloribacter litoris]|uniref:hypothetical protein n=1 Tax=Rhodocaloribacter litoris TaxID=2558931 RepID=UPI00141E6664|nr:hypothetical protein [Rhodocaloribacter litoris]QXD14592.1 hypothetical protein GQ464_014310 [Rhodocaloribacter litoris]
MLYEVHIPQKQLVLPITNPWVALSAALCRLKLDKRTDMRSRRTLLEELRDRGSVALSNDLETVEIVRCD